MDVLNRVVPTVGSSFANGKGLEECSVPDQFPVGLRVLVVDDDLICLKIVEKMLQRCRYTVTTCSQALTAINILRERKGCYDVVLSDVHMPDMDGYKLLELVGLEMDLPVIMMSADTRTSAVMKGVRHGACDYLIKPIRDAELKNIWQHVVRKKWIENKEHDHSGSFEDTDWHKRGDDVEYASSASEATDGVAKVQKKRTITKDEDDGEHENDDSAAAKKPRVVWSVELHQQFVSAVNQLGIDKAVPKRILELMNVPGLTRENVASHLQKFRLYLKRLSGVAQHSGIPSPFCGVLESSTKLSSLGRLDLQALAASGQIPSQTLAALHADLLGRPNGGLLSSADQAALLQSAIHSPKCISVEQGLTFGQPLVKCQPNILKSFSQNVVSLDESVPLTGLGAWPSTSHPAVGINLQNNSILDIGLRQQQQQKQFQPLVPSSSMLEPNRSINVQPSCLVMPGNSASFSAVNSPVSVNQNCDRNGVVDYSLLPQSCNSLATGSMPIEDIKGSGLVGRYSATVSAAPVLSSASVNGRYSVPVSAPLAIPSGSLNGESAVWSGQNTTIPLRSSSELYVNTRNSSCNTQYSYCTNSNELAEGALKSLGFVGRGNGIPSRFALDDLEALHGSNLSSENMYQSSKDNKVKQEPDTGVMDGARLGVPIYQQFPPNDLMSVFTD